MPSAHIFITDFFVNFNFLLSRCLFCVIYIYIYMIHDLRRFYSVETLFNGTLALAGHD